MLLLAGLLHTSSFLLSFFYTDVSSLDHMRLLCRFSISAKYKYDRSIACFWLVLTRVEPRCACSKRRSITDNVGGATLERLSAKIRSRNLWRWAFRENWIPRKFPAIRYVQHYRAGSGPGDEAMSSNCTWIWIVWSNLCVVINIISIYSLLDES